MSTYSFEVSFTPVCSCCGAELETLLTTAPDDVIDPYKLKDRRVMIAACQDCYEFKGQDE